VKRQEASGLSRLTTHDGRVVFAMRSAHAPIEVIWDYGPDGNVQHLAEHDVTPQEAEEVLADPITADVSRSTGRPIAFGLTRRGRRLAVVYEAVDAITVYPLRLLMPRSSHARDTKLQEAAESREDSRP